ncbi:MAG: thiolase family protein [bacterium]|nr:thiolase family protein [bacterium]
MSSNAVIVSATRTPIGSFQGILSSLSAPQLGAVVITEAISRAHINADDVDEVIMGNVLTAGVGQAPARQAALCANLPVNIPCLTVNKVCGSGLKAVLLARDAILLADAKIVVAGGMESMSNAPYLLPSARSGMRMGNQIVVDSMIHDGLLDPYSGTHMGNFGDTCADHYKFSRQEQDAFAINSYEKALQAIKDNSFSAEITKVNIENKKEIIIIDQDEEPGRYKPEKIAQLRSVFGKNGTVTAANASKINDGASAMIIMSENEAEVRKIKPLVKIIASSSIAQDPAWFTTAPVAAIKKVLAKTNLTVDDIDLFEINEAFSVVTMAAIKELSIDPSRVNVWGGAVALGHPIGSSGARILTTLIYAMRKFKAKRGLAAICIGGGEAIAVIVES